MPTNSEKNLVVLIDAGNTLYRYYHTQPPREVNGHRIESAQGLISRVRKFADGSVNGNVAGVVVVFDANTPNFRHELSEHYKAERSGMPEDLRPQEQLAKDGLRAMGIPVLAKDGYEADDTLGMVANHYVDQGYEVMIETTDKDMAQLVTDKITTYNPSSKKRFTPEGVKSKFGVGPEEIVDYLAIMGDSTDGIIGIDKVGAKTAARWLGEFGSLENIIDNADLIKGKVGDNLRESFDRLHLNKKLTTIIADPSLLSEDEKNELAYPQPSPAKAEQIKQTTGLNAAPIGGSVTDVTQASPRKVKEEPKKAAQPELSFEQGSLF